VRFQHYDTLVVGGTVVTDGWSGAADVAIIGERIAALLVPGDTDRGATADRVVDATGRYVMPGAVDPHCHLAIPLGEFTTLDDFSSASLAALAGGTTTIVDFAIPKVGQNPLEALDDKLAMARDSRCDYAFHGCLQQQPDDLDGIVAAYLQRGVRTIKLFTTYRGELMVGVDTIENVMRALRRVDGLTYVHAEENEAIEAAQLDAENRGFIGAGGMAGTRPEQAESDAVTAVLDAAERVGAPVYFVHQSTPDAVRLVDQARFRGVRAYSETCPHYLSLDDSCYDGESPELFVCCPPIRRAETRERLVELAERRFIHSIGSDHCCYSSEQKAICSHDVRRMPNGLPGVETRLPVVWTTLVDSGRLTPEGFVELISANPARLNGLYPRKGTLAPGADADVVILDATRSRTVRARDLHMATDYTPFEGWQLSGWPELVLLRGRIVLEGGQVVDPGRAGRLQESGPITAW
jgi:dihydropyrimidinase